MFLGDYMVGISSDMPVKFRIDIGVRHIGDESFCQLRKI
jgi:hypothetical protein